MKRSKSDAWPVGSYDVARDVSPIRGAVWEGQELLVSRTTVHGVLVVRMILASGVEVHMPACPEWLVRCGEAMAKAGRDEVSNPPFEPGRFRDGRRIG